MAPLPNSFWKRTEDVFIWIGSGVSSSSTPNGEGFSRHYDEALQRDTDVVFAYAAAARLIRAQIGGAAAA